MHHIFNTNFELELQRDEKTSLQSSFSNLHKKFLQYGNFFKKEGDTVFPEKPIAGQIVNSWGPSKRIESYAKKHHLHYTIPPWDVIKKIQSKAFAHSLSPLPGSQLITNKEELSLWLKDHTPPYVFKSFYGFSGTGHKFKPTNLIFPVIAEPWVNRSFDFSTQWEIKDKKLNYLGATILITDEKGRYKKSIVSKNEQKLFGENFIHLENQISFIQGKKDAFDLFFGNVAFDAFVYDDNMLQPICEINARKTFGFLALYLLNQIENKEQLTVSFDTSNGVYIDTY